MSKEKKKWHRLQLTLVAISLTAISFAGFGGAAKAQSQSITKNIYIGPERVDCTGVGSQTQKCYQYKENFNDSWQLLYSQIEGFDEYEEGFVYQLRVEVTSLFDTGGDALPMKYKLVRILSKLPASPQSFQPNQLPTSIVGRNWTLATLQSSELDIENTAGMGVTITFDADGRVSGSGGCNRYSGTYEVGLNNDLEIEGVVSTKMACSDSDGRMKLEAEYFEALEKVGSWAWGAADPNRLQLKMNNGNTLGYAIASEPGMPRTGGVAPMVMMAALAMLVLSFGLLLNRKL